MDEKVHDDPSCVETEADEVFVDGPDGVAVVLTPEAAVETGHRLMQKGAEAAGNRHFKQSGER